jgi:hypothetical protein
MTFSYHFAYHEIEWTQTTADIKIFNDSDDKEHNRNTVEYASMRNQINLKANDETNEEQKNRKSIDNIPRVTKEHLTLLT